MKSLRVQPRKNALSQPRKRFRKRLVRGKFLPQPSHIQQYKKWVRQGERFTPVLFAIYKDQPYLDGLDEKHVKTLQEHLKGNLNTKELLSGLNKGKTRIP